MGDGGQREGEGGRCGPEVVRGGETRVKEQCGIVMRMSINEGAGSRGLCVRKREVEIKFSRGEEQLDIGECNFTAERANWGQMERAGCGLGYQSRLTLCQRALVRGGAVAVATREAQWS